MGKLAIVASDDESSYDAVKLSEYDAIAATGNTIYFAQPVFEYVGALMQGHASFEEIRDLTGEPANFYIDSLAR